MNDVERFSGVPCFRCGECCRRFQVLLERAELQRISNYLHISSEEFVDRHADTRWPGENNWLVKQENGNCPFLQGTAKEHLCAVHEVKPRACRDWAASFEHTECRRGLKTYWHLDINSDGALLGTPEDLGEFREYLCRFE